MPADWPNLIVLIYSMFIVAGSLAGGWLPSYVRLTHTRLQLMMSGVGGLMLGVGLFHLLPHASVELGPAAIDRVVWWVMIGMLAMFFLLRMFHFHQHGTAEVDEQELDSGGGHHPHHDHDHDHDHDAGGHHAHGPSHRLSWVGVALGLSLHTLIDGMALGAAVRADSLQVAEIPLLLGFGTFLAIVLHKPLDAVSITSLMAASGWNARWRNGVNLLFALMCPLGALLFLAGASHLASDQRVVVGCALAFSAGVFICISLGDLLPELEFHAHDRIKLTAALLLGVALAYGIKFLEPPHVHQSSTTAAQLNQFE